MPCLMLVDTPILAINSLYIMLCDSPQHCSTTPELAVFSNWDVVVACPTHNLVCHAFGSPIIL